MSKKESQSKKLKRPDEPDTTIEAPANAAITKGLDAGDKRMRRCVIKKDSATKKSVKGYKAKQFVVEGIKHDQEKPRVGLVPVEAILAVSNVLTAGAKVYGDRNWELGISYERVYNATMRHLLAWWNGEDVDPDSGMSHLWHALTNLCFLVTYVERNMNSFDNRP